MAINEARLDDLNRVNHLLSGDEHFCSNEPMYIDISLNDFINRFLKGLKQDKDYSIEYNDNGYFVLTFAGQKNILTMSPARMKNYKKGIYDEETRKLHHLLEVYKTKKNDEESIERLELDPSEATAHEKKVYSLYLKKDASKALKGLAASGAFLSVFSVSTVIFIKALQDLNPSHELSNAGGLAMVVAVVTGAIGLLHLSFKEGLDSIKLKNILKKLRELKKTKIIETSQDESRRIDDPVLIEINKLLYSIQNLSPNAKARYLERITILLDEYKQDKLFLIEKERNPELFGFTANEEIMLKADYMKKVVDLELEIGQLLKKGQETESLEQQSSIVEQKIQQMTAGKRLA